MSATEPTIICPKCKTEIKLTESLAAPLVESIRLDYEKRLTQKDADMLKRETTLREREAAIAKDRESLDDQVADKLKLERSRIVAEESKKARAALSNDLDQKARELIELQDVLKIRDQFVGIQADKKLERRVAGQIARRPASGQSRDCRVGDTGFTQRCRVIRSSRWNLGHQSKSLHSSCDHVAPIPFRIVDGASGFRRPANENGNALFLSHRLSLPAACSGHCGVLLEYEGRP